MADNRIDNDLDTGTDASGKEPATKHDVTEGGALGAVGGAVVGALAGGPIGAVIGAIAGGVASAAAVDVVDKHDHDYARTTGHTTTDDTTVIDRTHDTDYAAPVAPAAYSTTTVPTDTTTGTTGLTAGTRTGVVGEDEEVVLPVVEEELEVGKREVQRGGAHIHSVVTETPVEEQVTLREEQVTVDRHPVERPVAAGDAAFQDRDIVITETDEVPVVAKQARVVEEVVVGKTATEHTETVRDTVRRTDVEVEETGVRDDLRTR